jgi:hypothetical protein
MPGKKGIGSFLWKNKIAVLGGAVVVSSGLWLWERLMKLRAQKIMNEVVKSEDKKSVPEMAGRKLDKRCLASGQELMKDVPKDKLICGCYYCPCTIKGNKSVEKKKAGGKPEGKEPGFVERDKDFAQEENPGAELDAELEPEIAE